MIRVLLSYFSKGFSMQKHKNGSPYIILPLLLLLPGCTYNPLSWIKNRSCCGSSHAGGEVLFTLNGKPVITTDTLDKDIQMIIEKRPEYEQFMKINENHFKKLVFEEKVNLALAEEWAKKNKIDSKKEFKDALELARKHLCFASLQEEVVKNLAISDEDATAFYDKSEYKAHFKTPAGVKAVAVEFNDDKQALDFLKRVRAPEANFEATAKAMQKEVSDLGLVSEHSFQVNKALKSKLLSLPTAPDMGLVKADDKTFYVYKATEKRPASETAFADLDTDKKEGIKNMMKQERFKAALDETFDKLSADFKAVKNEAYFNKDQEQPAPTTQSEAL